MARPRLALTALVCLTAAGGPVAVSASRGEAPQPADAPPAEQTRRPPTLEMPDISDSVQRRLTAPYLSPAEAAALRLFHGVPTEADLAASVAARARHALVRGAFADPALSDEQADVLDRAEAANERGEPAAALAMLGEAASPRAVRLRCEALEMLGRPAEAVAAGAPVADALAQRKLESPEDLVNAVYISAQLARLRGPQAENEDAGADHKALMAVLGGIRNRTDPFYWPAVLAEVRLLMEKDNPAQAAEALEQVLTLNPSCAAAVALLGEMSVNSFTFERARQFAAVADALHAGKAADEPGVQAESPLGAYVRARALVRQDDPDGADAALAPALVLYPSRRALHEARAAAQALRYDAAATDRVLAEYDLLTPGGPRAMYAAGRALAEARQYGPAAAMLARAAERAPHWAAVAIEQGLLEMQAGRDREALEALERAAKLDPFNVRANNSLTLLREVMGYVRTESEHFVVRSKPGLDTMLAREMLGPLEENFRAVTGGAPGAVDHVPPQATLIDLMPDHQWFAVRIAGLPKIHTIAASTGPIIAMETPREGPRHTGTYDWQRVVRHEYAHTVGLSRTGNRVPHWFTEAQAVYLENAPRAYSTIELLTEVLLSDGLFDFTEINIAFTRPQKPTDRAQAYAQGHWMYQFMVEAYGGPKVLALMDRFAAGTREEQAFRETFGVSREEFMGAFKPWAHRQLVAWGMLPPEGAPTVLELLKEEAEAAKKAAGAKSDEPAEDPQPTPALVAKWLAKYPAHPQVLELAVTQALAEAEDRVTPEVAALLRRYAAARPVDPLPHRHLARLALSEGDGSTAIEHLEFLDVREERVATWASQLAALYAQAGRLDEAFAKAERATRIAPYAAQHREQAATIALRRGDRATAKRHLEFLAALEPDRAIHRQRLEALERLGP